MTEMLERVARAIDGVQLWWRYNNWTEDRKKGFPIEVCRYGREGEPEIVVVHYAQGEEDDGDDVLYKIISIERARAAIEAMLEPTGDQMDAARHIIQWLSFERPTESALLKHCASLRKEPPPECRDVDHVPPARMIAFWIYRAMIDATLAEGETE